MEFWFEYPIVETDGISKSKCDRIRADRILRRAFNHLHPFPHKKPSLLNASTRDCLFNTNYLRAILSHCKPQTPPAQQPTESNSCLPPPGCTATLRPILTDPRSYCTPLLSLLFEGGRTYWLLCLRGFFQKKKRHSWG